MTTGLPPQPTCRHIVGGFLLFILLCVAFFALPNLVKWSGAVFTFLPGQLGLIEVVKPSEVRPVHMGDNPTLLAFDRPGKFALFTQNVDLLEINNAIVAAHSKPWIRLVASDGRAIPVTLVERGMAFFDTPFARGRPVALFEIEEPGSYEMFHPTRDDFAYVVPDYTFGKEGPIVFWMLMQAALVVVAVWFMRRRLMPPLTRIVVPPPTAAARTRFLEESVEREAASTASTPPSGDPWSPRQAVAAVDASAAPDPAARDIIAMLHDGRITPQQAEAEFEALLQQSTGSAAGWSAKLGLAQAEATAFSQGASMADIARLRYEGWPRTCLACGQPIDHAELTWWFARDNSGAPALRHIQCPSKPPA